VRVEDERYDNAEEAAIMEAAKVIADWWEEGAPAIPTKVLLLIEYMDEDGSRALAWRRTESTAMWDALGLCQMYLAASASEQTAARLRDGSDDA